MMVTQKVESVLSIKDRLGETPLWCERTARLWWIDIEEPKVQSYDPATGAHDVYPFDATYLGCLALTESGALLTAQDLQLAVFNSTTGSKTIFATLEKDLDNRLNDGRVDPRGRLWIGSMDNQLHRPNGTLYRVDPDGSVSTHLSGITVSNGITFSPDGRRMYFTDTRRYTSWVFDLDLDAGVLSNQRMFADYTATGDRPDGACMDTDGCMWAAFFGGGRVVRYTPEGAVDRVIAMPVTNPTCLCFGGPDYKTLYVTSAWKFLTEDQLAAEPRAGNLFAIEGVGQGFAEYRFGGA